MIRRLRQAANVTLWHLRRPAAIYDLAVRRLMRTGVALAPAAVRVYDALRRRGKRPGRVLYVGQSYYNGWYLSRELRELGWRADVLNWDANPEHAGYYHGEDYSLMPEGRNFGVFRHLRFYLRALLRYDVFHFTGAHNMRFSGMLEDWFAREYRRGAEIELLKKLGKTVVYSQNACLDGVAQSTFASWGERPVCLDCPWRERPDICSDEKNLAWGAFRNSVADYQVLVGGNRADHNLDPRCHEAPEYYCLDPDFWRPDLEIPAEFRLEPSSAVKIYHAVGLFDARSDAASSRNIKSTHIYVPLVEQLKEEGHDVELMFFSKVPNTELRYYQLQADVVVDMLTFGFFGANVREALMLGRPVVCYLRPEWLGQIAAEIPEYVEELPVISATPETVHDVLVDLIENPDKRREIGRRSREFAVKWHSADVAARRFDAIYRDLLAS